MEGGRVARFIYNMVCFSIEWLAEHGYSEFGQWLDAVFLLGHVKLDSFSVEQLAHVACAGDQVEVDIALGEACHGNVGWWRIGVNTHIISPNPVIP